jgi:maltooligosyltrehalose trehalohydrolase
LSADSTQLQLNERRRLPIGAEILDDGVHFRVWAPKRKRVDVRIGGRDHPLTREATGHFSGLVAGAKAGTLYKIVLDGGDAFPDPASRFQPHGPHEESEVIDPSGFGWTDVAWRGVGTRGV